MTLRIRLINIPERVHRGNLILKLAEDVSYPDPVFIDYVVADELVKRFDAA